MSYPTIDEQITAIKHRLATETYPGPNSYYRDKDNLRKLEAQKRGMREHHVDPMGYWFGGMSN